MVAFGRLRVETVASASNPPFDVWEIEPDFHAAEMRAFRADGSRNPRPQIAWRTDIPPERRQRPAHLLDLFNRSLINLFLRIETRAHGPFMQQVQQRAP